MTSTQLPIKSALESPKTKPSSKNNSSKSLGNSKNTVKGSSTGKKKRLRKTRRTLKKKQSTSDSESTSSESDNESVVPTKVQLRRKKRRTKKRVTESTAESLATLGRAYGNNVSKQNVSKVPERSQTVNKVSHSISSKSAASREYGDFFSCKTGLTYLETNRVDMIHSKGIKRFTDDYIKKLKKCQEFENGHNVQPFASVRLELLGENENNIPLNDAKNESLKDVAVHNLVKAEEKNVDVAQDKTKNLSASALRTIELIKKFKSGQSIEADIQVTKKKENVVADTKMNSRQRIAKAASDKNRSTSNENEMALTKEKGNAGKTNERKIKTTDKDTTVKKVVKDSDKSLEKFITAPDSAKKIDRKLASIEEVPSENSINLSLGSIGRNSSEYLNSKENPSRKSESSRHGYVLMKKVLENSVTILDGTNRYDSKKRSEESHYAGRVPLADRVPMASRASMGSRASVADRVPMASKATVDKNKSLKSIETLYRTDDGRYTHKNSVVQSPVPRRSQ